MMKEIELHLVDAAAPAARLRSGPSRPRDCSAGIDDSNQPRPNQHARAWSHKTVYGRALATGQRPGPDIDGGIDLTDDEFQAFLQAARS